MVVKSDSDWYCLATSEENVWQEAPIAVYKRKKEFEWVNVGIDFDTLDEAWDYLRFAPLLTDEEE